MRWLGVLAYLAPQSALALGGTASASLRVSRLAEVIRGKSLILKPEKEGDQVGHFGGRDGLLDPFGHQ